MGEGGEEGVYGVFDRVALRGRAIERLEVDEEGGYAFLKASLEVRSNELIEFVSWKDCELELESTRSQEGEYCVP